MLVAAALAAGCAEYPKPGSLDPVNLLCSGDYDAERGRCTIPVDFGIEGMP